MSALTAPRALTTRQDLGLIQLGIADNVTIFPGALCAVNATGFAQPATTSTVINIAGVYTGIQDGPVSNSFGLGTADNTGTGHTAGAFNVALAQGPFSFNMGTGGDVVTIANIGSMMFAIDDQTVGLTDGGGTRSPAGVLINVVGTQAIISVSIVNTRFAFTVANGIITTTDQTFVTGHKTFAFAAMPFFNNTADTFHVSFSSTVSANRVWTFPDAADTFVGTTATQTISAKTLTTPVIATGLTATGAGSVDFSGATSTMKTPTGLLTLSGDVAVGANKNIAVVAGTTIVDFSLGTGAMKTPTSSSSLFTFNQPKAASATANLLADPGSGVAIPVTADGVVAITTGGGAETNTLAIPSFVGQRMTFCLDTAGGGTRTVTAASAINVAGHTHFLLVTARQSITLQGITLAGTRCWEILANIGTVVTN